MLLTGKASYALEALFGFGARRANNAYQSLWSPCSWLALASSLRFTDQVTTVSQSHARLIAEVLRPPEPVREVRVSGNGP